MKRVVLTVARITLFLAIIGATLYFLAAEISAHWTALQSHLQDLSAGWLAAAVLLFFLGQVCLTLQWIVLVNDLSQPLRLGVRPGFAVVNVTQLTKYLPGRVWAYGLQALWLRSEGFQASRVAFAGLVQQVFAVFIAFSVGGSLAVFFLPELPRTLTILAAVAFVLGTLICFVYYNLLFEWAAKLCQKVFGLTLPSFRLSGRSILTFALLYAAFLVLFAGALYCSAQGLSLSLNGQALGAVVAAVLISDLIGLLVLVVPGGLGVRESSIYLFLTPVLGVSTALLFPLVTRALYIVNDLVLGALSAVILTRARALRRHEAAQHATASPFKPLLIVLSSGYPRYAGDVQGGAPFVHELSKRLVPDYDVHVLTPYCTGSKSSDTMDGVTILRFRYLPPGVSDLTGGGGIMDNLKASPLNYVKVLPLLLVYSFKLAQLLLGNSRRSIVVHAHWSIPQGVLAACAKWTIPMPFKVMCTVHGSDFMRYQSPAMALVQRFALVSADVVTVVSESLKASVEARFPSVTAHVAPMGIDSEVFHPSRYDEKLRRKYAPEGQMILFVGFLVEVKGVDTLLRAFQLLAPAFPKAQLVIVGDGQERSALAGLATELGLANRVCFAGALPQAELAAFYATADVFVGPSRREGFGLVFAEAMCSGSLVIGSDIPPLRQFITPGITGWLATPDDPESFRNAMHRVLSELPILQPVRLKARAAIVQRLDWPGVADRYRGLLGGARGL